MVIYCARCEASNSDQAPFCSECDHPLTAAKPAGKYANIIAVALIVGLGIGITVAAPSVGMYVILVICGITFYAAPFVALLSLDGGQFTTYEDLQGAPWPTFRHVLIFIVIWSCFFWVSYPGFHVMEEEPYYGYYPRVPDEVIGSAVTALPWTGAFCLVFYWGMHYQKGKGRAFRDHRRDQLREKRRQQGREEDLYTRDESLWVEEGRDNPPSWP